MTFVCNNNLQKTDHKNNTDLHSLEHDLQMLTKVSQSMNNFNIIVNDMKLITNGLPLWMKNECSAG